MIQCMIDEIALGDCNTSENMVMLGFWLQPFVCTHHHFSPMLTLKHHLGCYHLTFSSFLAISKNGLADCISKWVRKKLVVSGNFHNVFLEQNQATRCCPLSFRFFARSWWVEFLFWKRNRTWDYVTLEKNIYIYINIDTQLLKSFSSSLKTLETYNALLFNSWIVRHADSTSIFTAALEDSKQLNTNTSMNHASTARGLGPKLMEFPSLPPKQLVTWRFIPL